MLIVMSISMVTHHMLEVTISGPKGTASGSVYGGLQDGGGGGVGSALVKQTGGLQAFTIRTPAHVADKQRDLSSQCPQQ